MNYRIVNGSVSYGADTILEEINFEIKNKEKIAIPKIFTVLKNGAKMEYDVILTFKSEITGKDYVVYTDNSYDDKNKLRIYAAIYNPMTNEYLGPVEEKDEWIEIGKLLDKVML